jgi:hypothetical protein
MSIAERLIELKLIKHNLKTIINGLGGSCDENFTLYHTFLEKLITERDPIRFSCHKVYRWGIST